MRTSARTAALGYLGNHVTVDTSMARLGTRAGRIHLRAGDVGKEAIVRVVDSTGRVVRVLAGGGVTGSNTVAWDGKDMQR